MAEAAGTTKATFTHATHSSSDSSNPIVVPTTLEDVAEEEDVFLPDKPIGKTQIKRENNYLSGHKKLETAAALTLDSQMEDDFLHLTIRKQVSYR